MNASRRTVRVMEFAHLWAVIQNMPGDQVEGSSEKFRFDIFERQEPEEAALAKKIQFDAFDRVNAAF